MALSAAQIETVARELAARIFTESVTAHSDVTALKAAISAIDTGMDATTNQAATLYPGATIKAALRTRVQDNAPNLTTQEAGVALALWALHEVGLL